MKTDIDIQKDVLAQLEWEPIFQTSDIKVAVKHGIVTLSGQVDTYSKKLAAENAVKKIKGVKAIAEDIQIGVSPGYNKTDTEIAEAVLMALKSHTAVQEEKVKIKVENRVVQLEGEVEWAYQRNAAKAAIENIVGVGAVINLITVRPQMLAADIEQKISAAFHRHATIDAENITVDITGNKVTLRGEVRSLAEKEDAVNAAWAAPGITAVDDKLSVKMVEYMY
jgi:osmotically-inducible protein OsmY